MCALNLNDLLSSLASQISELASTPEIKYSILLIAVFVFPRLLHRIGLPLALSTFFLGIVSDMTFKGLATDPTLSMFSTLGIISLFFFAGIEVEPREIFVHRRALLGHIIINAVLVVVSYFFVSRWFVLGPRASWLFSLALLTPSTGFILDTLESSQLVTETKFWIRTKAIAAEIVALIAMFVVMQSESLKQFLNSFLILVGLLLLLPVLIRFFARKVAPFAPNSEFAFFIILALLFGLVTKKIGAYYLVGAFVVGIGARRFENLMPELRSGGFLKSVRFFSSFFVPFYFFKAGLQFDRRGLSFDALKYGLLLLILVIPIRLLSVLAHRKVSLGEGIQRGLPVASSLLPNLVFGLVLAEILSTYFSVPQFAVGALVVYTIGVTLIPPLILKIFWNNHELAQLPVSEVSLK